MLPCFILKIQHRKFLSLRLRSSTFWYLLQISFYTYKLQMQITTSPPPTHTQMHTHTKLPEKFYTKEELAANHRPSF